MLPFIAGAAAGVVAVIVYNNNKKIRKEIKEGAKKAADAASGLKKCVEEKVSSLGSKKELQGAPEQKQQKEDKNKEAKEKA